MALPALAAEEPELVIAPADTGYGQTIVLNGETLDLTGIPASPGRSCSPCACWPRPTTLRLLG